MPLVQPSYYKPVQNGHLPNQQANGDIPKYLEIICDGFEPPFNDGYEIPRGSIRSSTKSFKAPEDRSRTLSTSSTLSNGSASSNHHTNNMCNRNGVQKTIAEKLLNVSSTNGENCFRSLTTQPLLEAEDSNSEINTSMNTNTNVS